MTNASLHGKSTHCRQLLLLHDKCTHTWQLLLLHDKFFPCTTVALIEWHINSLHDSCSYCMKVARIAWHLLWLLDSWFYCMTNALFCMIRLARYLRVFVPGRVGFDSRRLSWRAWPQARRPHPGCRSHASDSRWFKGTVVTILAPELKGHWLKL